MGSRALIAAWVKSKILNLGLFTVVGVVELEAGVVAPDWQGNRRTSSSSSRSSSGIGRFRV